MTLFLSLDSAQSTVPGYHDIYCHFMPLNSIKVLQYRDSLYLNIFCLFGGKILPLNE